MIQDKKGQGLVTGIIAGVGVLVITMIVIFLVVSTLNGAGLIARDSNSTTEESVTFVDSGTELTSCDAEADGIISTIVVINHSGAEVLTADNYSTVNCLLSQTLNAGIYNSSIVNITYTYSFDAEEQISADQMISNFTTGVNNVSNKLPTILLVAAVVILFGAIVLLVKQSRTLTGGGTGSGGGL